MTLKLSDADHRFDGDRETQVVKVAEDAVFLPRAAVLMISAFGGYLSMF